MTTNVHYNLNKALYYLGPKASQQGINYYISNIAITILRVINYLFEGKWYNNDTARSIILQYAKDGIVSDSPAVRTDIQRLFREIKLRPNVDLSDNRVSLTVNPLSSESRIGKTFSKDLIEEGKQVIGECSALGLNIYVLDREIDMQRPIHLDEPRPAATVGSAPAMKPKTVHEIFEKALNEFEGAFWNVKENLSVSEYDEAKIAARLYTTQLMSGVVLTESDSAKGEEAVAKVNTYEKALTRKELCAKALATLIKEDTEIPLLKKAFAGVRSIGEMLVFTNFRQLEIDEIADHLLQKEVGLIEYIESTMLPLSNPLLKNIKDPHKLLRVALLEAQTELGAATPTEDRVIRHAIYNLIKQAYVNRSGCHPVLELNEYIHVSTHAPKIFFTADGLYETEVYPTDLFTSLTNPSDPLKVKELINDGLSADQFSKHIVQIANQIKLKHLTQVNETLKGPSTPGDIKGSFEDYIKRLKTPHEIMHHALLFAAHSLAEKQLINADDVVSNAWVSNYICYYATVLILSHARATTDFSLQLNDYVTIECEKHFVKECLGDDKLISRELFTSNIFTPDHIDNVTPTDPVRVQAILESFAGNKKFIERYILAKPLHRLYEPENDDNSFASFQFDLVNSRVENLPTEQKETIKALKREIEAISSHLTGFYNGMSKELCSMITSPNQIRPVVPEPFEARTGFITKEIQWQHIDIEQLKRIHSKFQFRFGLLGKVDNKEIEDLFVVRQRSSIQEELPNHLAITNATLAYANSGERIDRSRIMKQQYTSLTNPVLPYSCMYGALAQEIFGEDEAQERIEGYSTFLRRTAASYIMAHADDFIESEITPDERVWIRTHRNYERALEILKPSLVQRLHTFCNDTTLSGDERTMTAIAKVFGIGVDVIDYESILQLDSKGVIQPNGGVETEVSPKAFLSFGGFHFTVLRRKTE